MRASAILMVLFSHALWIFSNTNQSISLLFNLLGFWGVEIFFVLSGFLIGKILINLFCAEEISFNTVRHFLKRRWFRTLPNYYIILILNIVLAFFLEQNFTNTWEYFFFLQNFAKTLPAFFPESWSLSVEEWAYILLPLSLLFAMKFFKINKQKTFIITVIILWLIFFLIKVRFNFYNNVLNLSQWNVSLKAVVIYRIDAILTGVIMAWLYVSCKKWLIKNGYLFASIGVAILIFMLVGVGYFKLLIENYPFFWNVLYLPLTSLGFVLFIPFLVNFNSNTNWFTNSITTISKISYSIYLLHYSIILQLIKYLIKSYQINFKNEIAVAIIYIIVTLIVSYFWYKHIEKPLTDLRDK